MHAACIRFAALSLLFSVACAVDKYYVGGTGDWETVASWDPAGIPGPLDDVYITSASRFTVSLTKKTQVNSLTIGAGKGQKMQSLNVLEQLSVLSNSTVLVGGEVQLGNQMSINATLLVDGYFTFSVGTLSGSGVLHVSALGTLSLEESGAKQLVGVTTRIAGTASLLKGNLVLRSAARVHVLAGGMFHLMSEKGFQILPTDRSSPLLLIDGTLKVEPGDSVSTQLGCAVQVGAQGVVSVQSGELWVTSATTTWQGTLSLSATPGGAAQVAHFSAGRHAFNTSSLVAGAGTLSLEAAAFVSLGGRLTVANVLITAGSPTVTAAVPLGSLQIPTLHLMQGVLTGSSLVEVSDLRWSGGTIRVTRLEVINLVLDATQPLSLRSTYLSIQGRLSFAQAQHVQLAASPTIYVAPEAAFLVVAPLIIDQPDRLAAAFIVDGMMRVSSTFSLQASFTIGAPSNYAGSVQLLSGADFSINGAVFNDGLLQVGSNTTLTLQAPAPAGVFTRRSVAGGQGTLVCQGCLLSVQGSLNITSFHIFAGSVTFERIVGWSGPPNFTVENLSLEPSTAVVLVNRCSRPMNLLVGTLFFRAGSVTANANNALEQAAGIVARRTEFATSDTKTLRDVVLRTGPAAFHDAAALALVGYAALSIEADFAVAHNMTVTSENAGCNSAVTVAAGGRLLVAPGAMADVAVELTNAGGAVDLGLGATLTCRAGLVQLGGASTLGAATLAVPAGFSVQIRGGSLSGCGLINGDVSFSGQLAPLYPSLTLPQKLRITGNVYMIAPGELVASVGYTDAGDVFVAGELQVDKQLQVYGGALSVNLTAYPGTVEWPTGTQFAGYGGLVGIGWTQFVNAPIGGGSASTGGGGGGSGIAFAAGASALLITAAPGSEVSGIVPAAGRATGGERVTIRGSDFPTDLSQLQVTIGGRPCTDATLAATGTVECDTPPGSGADSVVCVLAQGRGCWSRKPVHFAYSAPSVYQLQPHTELPTAGGTRITLDGYGFGDSAAAISISVGNATCADVEVLLNFTRIACTCPPGSGKNVPLAVTANSLTGASRPLSYAAPSVSSVCPRQFVPGEQLRVFGSNLAPYPCDADCVARAGVSVLVGSAPCTAVAVVSSSELTCVVPEGSGGASIQVSGGNATAGLAAEYIDVPTGGFSALPMWAIIVIAVGCFLVGLLLGSAKTIVGLLRPRKPTYEPLAQFTDE